MIEAHLFSDSLFIELSLVIGIGVIMAVIMRLLRQPLIISHIITGLIVGPFILNVITAFDIFHLFSQIGIAILLFTVGLHLNPQIIKQFGKISLATGLGQVLFTALVGFLICLSLGFSPIAAVYVSIALAFSSTIIILKLISDKGEMESLYAKISVGFLLVQDIIALILLFSIPIIASEGSSYTGLAIMFAKGIGLAILAWVVANRVLKPLNKFLSGSQELLFLFSLSWGFIVAAVFLMFGFSLETGALIAGVSLATLPSREEISARLMPLRDFFIVVFFIMLGAQMVLTGLWQTIPIALILSLFVLIGNPIILMIIMGRFGYKKSTSFKTGLTVAQISEFSLILVALGLTYGHIDTAIMSTVTLIALITIFFSTYMIMYSDNLYNYLEKWLSIFEKKQTKEKEPKNKKYPIVLFGCNRIGHDFVENFRHSKKKFMIVDYDPEAIESFSSLNIACEYGDAGDINFLESLELKAIELAVSTIPVLATNKLLTEVIRKKNKKAVIMMVAHSIQDAIELYDKGVDYVVLPHFLGGRHAADIVLKLGNNRRKFSSLKNKHLDYLQKKLSLGHDHPMIR
ncbi:MAG: cation:proton antiporter [Patescibacteria group bacterium]|nr:MAG: cation:proton antiporter [Patescibacteria group bacterium]